MVLEKMLSRRGHERLDSNIHVTNKTIFRPGINTRGADRAIRIVGALQSQAAWQHDNVERWENETCVESKLTVPKASRGVFCGVSGTRDSYRIMLGSSSISALELSIYIKTKFQVSEKRYSER
ncbi:hypothetical protein BDR07DRAFT_1396435 [Suillus spraguei]|nr:hypothetical protein BDR07DRAFT_1396435 [Suillus spraguei]